MAKYQLSNGALLQICQGSQDVEHPIFQVNINQKLTSTSCLRVAKKRKINVYIGLNIFALATTNQENCWNLDRTLSNANFGWRQ